MNDLNTAWCGLDIAKSTFDAAYHSSGAPTELQLLPVQSFRRTPAGMRAFYRWIDSRVSSQEASVRVVMEATGRFSLETASWILADRPELQPAIVNPRLAAAFCASLGLRNKTDRIDARALARMGKERCPRPFEPPPETQKELRALTRMRMDFVQERTATKNRLKEPCDLPFARRKIEQHLQHLDQMIAEIEAEMEVVIEKSESFSNDRKLIETIPGVGPITAMTVLAELGDLSAYQRSRQLSSMVGLSPREFTSGSSIHRRTRMSKQGNVNVRTALFMAARSAAAHNPHLSVFYKRLRERGKSHLSALGAVMRKLIVLMRALIRSQSAYNPKWASEMSMA